MKVHWNQCKAHNLHQGKYIGINEKYTNRYNVHAASMICTVVFLEGGVGIEMFNTDITCVSVLHGKMFGLQLQLC